MQVYEATYEGLEKRPFNDSYKKYIQEHITKYVSAFITVTFTEKSFKVDATASTPLQLCHALIFIGYAFCQQDEGR